MGTRACAIDHARPSLTFSTRLTREELAGSRAAVGALGAEGASTSGAPAAGAEGAMSGWP